MKWLNRLRPAKRRSTRRLTLLGRAVALISSELIANAACWTAAGICLRQADGLLGLALLAWTIGLRHGLDADHISAIDNATRQLVSLGQLPITCGLFFSLGHSTIVIAVNVAIAISVDVYNKLDKVGSIGGIVGTSVSASFLFFIACINIYFLVGAIKQRRLIKRRQALGLPPDENEASGEGGPTKVYGGGCLVRIIGPVLRTVDRPWKMYPVGILFGFGFDTASSIALLAISAIAQRGANGEAISHGKIVILPFLFTAGMSLVDSLDSILMLYAYAAPTLSPGESRFALLHSGPMDKTPILPYDETEEETGPSGQQYAPVSDPASHIHIGILGGDEEEEEQDTAKDIVQPDSPGSPRAPVETRTKTTPAMDSREERVLSAKANTISSLSILLTLLSILVALSISLIEIMGLIGENCASCQEAADDPDGGGLAGSWWRAWARANDQSGYIGAAIVGCFAAILLGWYVARWGVKRWKSKSNSRSRAAGLAPVSVSGGFHGAGAGAEGSV